MNPTIFFSVCSIIYCILLFVVFKMENNKKNDINSMFKFLLISNFLGLILEVIVSLVFGVHYENYKYILNILIRLIPLYHMIWMAGFIIYIMLVSSSNGKISKKIRIIVWAIVSLLCVIDFFLPFNVKLKNDVLMYSYGLSVNFVFIYCLAGYIISLFIMFKNINTLNKHKYAPLFALISSGTIITMIQSTYPECLLSISMHTFVLYIAYINIRKNQIQSIIDSKKTEKK
ncbi:MAG: hypothetical protein MR296_04590 [Tenericutes bacterium]|nr:hypothetical protein [Mycoplasmatota bacterium]